VILKEILQGVRDARLPDTLQNLFQDHIGKKGIPM